MEWPSWIQTARLGRGIELAAKEGRYGKDLEEHREVQGNNQRCYQYRSEAGRYILLQRTRRPDEVYILG